MTINLTDPIFHDGDHARQHMEAIRWPNGPTYPHCGSVENIKRLEGRSRKVTQWTFERLAQAVGIAVYVLAVTPLMIYFAWPMASAQPAVNGNCNNFGNNNINCSSLSFTPPHRRLDPDKLEAFSERQTPPYLSTRSRLIIPEID